MTCPRCNHYWCWSCGLPVNHWIHTFSENPFGCKFTATNGSAMLKKTGIFLLGLLLLPLGMLLLPILAAIFYGIGGGLYCVAFAFGCLYSHQRLGVLCRTLLILFALPAFAVCLGLALALGALGTGACGIAVVPVMIVHTYMYFRSLYWWNKTR